MLDGDFVCLRRLKADDAAMTLAWRRSPRADLLNRGASTVAEQRAWIERRPESEFNFVIELKSGRAVGMISLVDVDMNHRRAEPARFLIGEEDACRGIPAAVEAMKLLYHLAFDQLGLLRVYGVVAADNVRMLKWQHFLGMKEEGRQRDHLFINGRFQDAVLLGMLASEYRAEALPRMNMLIAAGRHQFSRGQDIQIVR